MRKGVDSLRTGTGMRRGSTNGSRKVRKQLTCPGGSIAGPKPLERGEGEDAGGGKDAILRLCESHGPHQAELLHAPKNKWLFLGSPQGYATARHESPVHPADSCHFLPAFRARGLALRL